LSIIAWALASADSIVTSKTKKRKETGDENHSRLERRRVPHEPQ
jgi:hypothetical protein